MLACALHGGHVTTVPHASPTQLAQVMQAAGDPRQEAKLIEQTPCLQTERTGSDEGVGGQPVAREQGQQYPAPKGSPCARSGRGLCLPRPFQHRDPAEGRDSHGIPGAVLPCGLTQRRPPRRPSYGGTQGRQSGTGPACPPRLGLAPRLRLSALQGLSPPPSSYPPHPDPRPSSLPPGDTREL